MGKVAGVRDELISEWICVVWSNPENVEGKRGSWSGCPAMCVAHVGAIIVKSTVAKVPLPERAVGAKRAVDHVTPFAADQFEPDLIVCCGKVRVHLHRPGKGANRAAFLRCLR